MVPPPPVVWCGCGLLPSPPPPWCGVVWLWVASPLPVVWCGWGVGFGGPPLPALWRGVGWVVPPCIQTLPRSPKPLNRKAPEP